MVMSMPQPNLIFVFADQLRYSSCGYAGDPLAHTPNIDRLAAQGTSFSNAVSSTPVCSAYRASLLTGKYTTSTGMAINELRLSPDHERLEIIATGPPLRAPASRARPAPTPQRAL